LEALPKWDYPLGVKGIESYNFTGIISRQNFIKMAVRLAEIISIFFKENNNRNLICEVTYPS
jgi:hypothetical protein